MGGRGRGKAYTVSMDRALTASFIDVTQDVKQKEGETYWTHVRNRAVGILVQERLESDANNLRDRKWTAVRDRHNLIQRTCLWWHSAVLLVGDGPSGCSEDERELLQLKIFKELHDDQDFQFKECYALLKPTVKFLKAYTAYEEEKNGKKVETTPGKTIVKKEKSAASPQEVAESGQTETEVVEVEVMFIFFLFFFLWGGRGCMANFPCSGQ